MNRLLRALDRHWFEPAPLADLAIVRIVIVGGQLLFFLPELAEQFELLRSDAAFWAPIPALKVLLLPFGWGARPDAMFLHAVWLAAIASGMLAILGLYTRPSLLLFAAANTILTGHRYSYGEQHHGEALITILLWVLAVAPSGARWSVDDLRGRVRRSVWAMRFEPDDPSGELSPNARWPLRLGQWLLVLIYLSAGMSKLLIGGRDWFNGYTLVYVLARDGIDYDKPLGQFLAGFPELGIIVALTTVAFEMTFALAILVPPLTWLYLLGGAALHIGIILAQSAPFLEYLVCYSVFIEQLRRTLPSRLRPRVRTAEERWSVIYDSLCPLCIRTMVVLQYLDFRRRLAFVDVEHGERHPAIIAAAVTPSEGRAAMHVLSPDGAVHRGFYAFRELARLLPLLWPLVPLLYLPLAGQLGAWAYARVADNRKRVPCRVTTCQV